MTIKKSKVYVDAFNLYFGRLRKSDYLWLSIRKFIDNILLEDEFKREIPEVKYFSAEILEVTPGRDGKRSRQSVYLNALENYEEVQIVLGQYTLARKTMLKFIQGSKRPRGDEEKVDVWRLEEKMTDVNIVTEMLFDIFVDESEIDEVILVSNDRDLAPALKKIKETRPEIRIIVISPRRGGEMPAKLLAEVADLHIHRIPDSVLKVSQMPIRIKAPNLRTNPVKPVEWFPDPDKMTEIISLVMEIKKTEAASWAWLCEQGKPHRIDGLRNIPAEYFGDYLGTSKQIEIVLEHIRVWHKFEKKKLDQLP